MADHAKTHVEVPALGPAPAASSAAVSRSMKGNKRRNTSPELRLRAALRKAGLAGYRLDWRDAPGRPDIAYVGLKIAIFVQGCYWHRCPHCNLPMPRSNTDFWQRKFLRNKERDARKEQELRAAGWIVIVAWECTIRDRIDDVVAGIKKARALRQHRRAA